jgi:hypothetical protein
LRRRVRRAREGQCRDWAKGLCTEIDCLVTWQDCLVTWQDCLVTWQTYGAAGTETHRLLSSASLALTPSLSV